MRKKTALLGVLIMTFLSQSCYYDNREELYQNFPQDCITTGLTFSADIKPIVNVCLDCHFSGGESPTLNTVQDFRDNEINVLDRISRPLGEGGIMPPNGPMPKCNIDKITQWYLDGALE